MSNDDVIKPTVLVVDDTPVNIALLSGLLREDYRVKVATNGEKAILMIKHNPPDVILMDVMMPVMDGYETCKLIKKDEALKDIPIIFLTAKTDVEDESKGFEMGAEDYITKPVNPIILLSRVKTHVALKKANDFLVQTNNNLQSEIAKTNSEMALIQEVTIMAMASLAEIRDSETGYHLQRTKLYVKILCDFLATKDKYKTDLAQSDIDLIVTSAPLHDIGKVGIPDSILLKPGILTTEEFSIMKTHTSIGLEAIQKAERLMNRPETFLKYPKEIVYSHHEKWNGLGYPQGICGEDIPLSARIVALADVYDALISRRTYKDAYTHEEAVEIIQSEKGRHFDPDLVDAFMEVHQHFYEISNTYRIEH